MHSVMGLNVINDIRALPGQNPVENAEALPDSVNLYVVLKRMSTQLDKVFVGSYIE